MRCRTEIVRNLETLYERSRYDIRARLEPSGQSSGNFDLVVQHGVNIALGGEQVGSDTLSLYWLLSFLHQ